MERILCAAIYFDDEIVWLFQPENIVSGYVLCGYRHHIILEQTRCVGLVKEPKDRLDMKQVQGFLTSHNRFVGREEARELALKSGQITNDSLHETKLFSEDLY